MTQVESTYGQAMYDLAKEEGLSASVLEELTVLSEAFSQEPNFVRLLSAPNLSKEERCAILDDSFRGKVAPYVLNFMKILTEKGYARYFCGCCQVYRDLYNEDNGILPVTAVTALPLDPAQTKRLTEKLSAMTGKSVCLTNRVEPGVMGGVRLDYSGIRIDGTVKNRLESVAQLLKNTVL